MELKLQENKIQEIFISKKQTLSLAESCTGGGVSSRLVQLPGSSQYFLGSVVSYSCLAKEKILGVDPQTIASYGEVSSQTAEEMAVGALKHFESDIALSITGIAGPAGGSQQKPVGTVFFSIASKIAPPIFWSCQFQGQRREVISQAIDAALERLLEYMIGSV